MFHLIMKFSITIFIVALSFPLFSCKVRKSSTPAPTPLSAAPEVMSGFILAKKDAMLPVGSVLSRETRDSLFDGTIKIVSQGQDITGTIVSENVQTETLTILSDAQMRLHTKPTVVTAKIIVNDAEQNTPKEKSSPLDSLNVLLDKQESKWTASLENGATPSDSQKKALEKQAANFNSADEVIQYGDMARQPGDKWSVDIATLQSFGGYVSGTAKGKIEFEFVEIATFEGAECAIIKSTFIASGTTPEEDDQASMTANIKGTTIIYRSIKDLTDLQTTVDGEIEIKGLAGPNAELMIKGKNRSSTKTTIKKPN